MNEPSTSIRAVFVDDDALIRRAFTRAGSHHGVRVFAVATIEQARAEIARRDVDVVVLDFHLQLGSSAAFARALADAGMRVIALSGDPTRARAALPATVPVLAKSGAGDALFEHLRALVGER